MTRVRNALVGALESIKADINALIAWCVREKWYQLCAWRIAGNEEDVFRDAPTWFVREIYEFGRPDYFDDDELHDMYDQAVAELTKRQRANP